MGVFFLKHGVLCIVGIGQGLGEIDNKLFVVFETSSNIEVYDAQTFSQLEIIKVNGLIEPHDIVACPDDHQLYVADKDGIWKVSTTVRNEYEKWLTTESVAGTFYITTLSLTSHRLIVTSQYPSLRQYSTTDRQLLCTIKLPRYVEDLYHATETPRGTFVVGHRGTARDELQYAVSTNSCHDSRHWAELFSVLKHPLNIRLFSFSPDLFDHPRGVVYNFGRVCQSVCVYVCMFVRR